MITKDTRAKNKRIFKKFFSKQINEDLSKKTKEQYLFYLNKWSKIQQAPLQELIDEAILEQTSYMDNHNRIIQPDVENSKLSERLDMFIAHEQEDGNSETTIDVELRYTKAFYRKMGVKEFPYFKKPKSNTKRKTLTKERIKRGIELSNFKKGTLYEFLAATGMRIGDVSKLSVENWMDSVNIQSLQQLITYNEEDIPLGYWEYIPNKTKNSSGMVCKVGCAKSANRRILRMLKQRHLKKPLTLDQPLFANNKGGYYTVIGMSSTTRTVDKKLYDQDMKHYKMLLETNQISEEKYNEKINQIPKFHCHGFRHFFITTLGNKGVPIRLACCMEAHKPPLATDTTYVDLNKESILKAYSKIEKYVSMEDETESDLRKKIDKLQKQLTKNKEDIEELTAKL
jgi:integrase